MDKVKHLLINFLLMVVVSSMLIGCSRIVKPSKVTLPAISSSACISVVSTAVVDTSEGDGDGEADIFETFDLFITLKNIGYS